jgi:CBS-domain-containing membrane protein
VPVVDIGDVVVGMVSEADLISREGFSTVRSHHLAGLVEPPAAENGHHWAVRAEGISAGELMTTRVVSCGLDEPLATVVRRMLQHDVRSLPVLDEGRLVGIVSRRDCLALFDRPDVELAAAISTLLADARWTPEGQSIGVAVIDGVVTLSGQTRYSRDRDFVCDLARQAPGVVEVVSRLSAQYCDPDATDSFSDDGSR